MSSQSNLKLRRKWRHKIPKNPWELRSDFQTLSRSCFTLFKLDLMSLRRHEGNLYTSTVTVTDHQFLDAEDW